METTTTTNKAILFGCNYFNHPQCQTLAACENDSRDIGRVLEVNGFATKLFIGKDMTRENYLNALRDLVETLEKGSIGVVQISTHGSPMLTDYNKDETDKRDEAIVFYGGTPVLDDESVLILSTIQDGATIIFIGDLCYAHGQTRDMNGVTRNANFSKELLYEWAQKYTDAAIQKTDLSAIKGTILFLSACSEKQTALDGDKNGLFTGTLLKFLPMALTYKELMKKTIEFVNIETTGDQTPTYKAFGINKAKILNQKPFSTMQKKLFVGRKYAVEASVRSLADLSISLPIERYGIENLVEITNEILNAKARYSPSTPFSLTETLSNVFKSVKDGNIDLFQMVAMVKLAYNEIIDLSASEQLEFVERIGGNADISTTVKQIKNAIKWLRFAIDFYKTWSN